ncbi:IclR family transcriptional regulator [Kribbella sp. NPDC051620]|uniref:IclR family transcriptional regulator n=1 Tax=Kribbella sp. NPDC051620 TaxID=3364120 RepID=UPI0037AB2043
MSEVQSVQRALLILERLAESGTCGVQQLARDCELAPSTVQRLVGALVAAGLVEQDSERTYRVTWRLFRWGQAPVSRLGLRELAKPYMQELAAEVGETIALGVRDGDSVMHIEWIPARHLVQPRVQIGDRVPLVESSLGRCLLAWLPESDLEPFLASRPELGAALKTVREQGHCLVENDAVGIRTLAVPVWGSHAEVVGTIGIGGPMHRFSAERAAAVLPSVVAVGDAVTSHFGVDSARGRSRMDGVG